MGGVGHQQVAIAGLQVRVRGRHQPHHVGRRRVGHLVDVGLGHPSAAGPPPAPGPGPRASAPASPVRRPAPSRRRPRWLWRWCPGTRRPRPRWPAPAAAGRPTPPGRCRPGGPAPRPTGLTGSKVSGVRPGTIRAPAGSAPEPEQQVVDVGALAAATPLGHLVGQAFGHRRADLALGQAGFDPDPVSTERQASAARRRPSRGAIPAPPGGWRPDPSGPGRRRRTTATAPGPAPPGRRPGAGGVHPGATTPAPADRPAEQAAVVGIVAVRSSAGPKPGSRAARACRAAPTGVSCTPEVEDGQVGRSRHPTIELVDVDAMGQHLLAIELDRTRGDERRSGRSGQHDGVADAGAPAAEGETVPPRSQRHARNAPGRA